MSSQSSRKNGGKKNERSARRAPIAKKGALREVDACRDECEEKENGAFMRNLAAQLEEMRITLEEEQKVSVLRTLQLNKEYRVSEQRRWRVRMRVCRRSWQGNREEMRVCTSTSSGTPKVGDAQRYWGVIHSSPAGRSSRSEP